MGHAVNDEIPFEHYTGVTGETIAYVVLDEARASFEAGNLSEDGTIAGLYYQAFTPDALGWWRVLITDGTLIRQLAYLVGSGQEKDIEDKVDILDTNIDTILADLADGGRLDLLIDDILADTNELQGDWANDGRLDQILDNILADTGELQTDWADGGRLDLLIDSIITALGSELDGSPDLHDILVTGYNSSEISYDINGSILERLEMIMRGISGSSMYTADAATVNTVTDAELSATDDFYKGQLILFISGAQAYKARYVSSYDGTNKILHVTPDWTSSPGTSAYLFIRAGEARYLMETGKGLEATFDTVDAIPVASRVADTLPADGSEQTLFIMNAPGGIVKPQATLIDLGNMAAGDTIVVREYYRIKDGGDLEPLDGKPYSGAQPANQQFCQIEHKPYNRWGYEITLEQTGGTNRDYDWEHYYEG